MNMESPLTPETKTTEKPASKDKKKKKNLPKGNLILCTENCRYNVIKRVCRRMEFKLDANIDSDWDVYWSDAPVQPEQISKIKQWQRINAMPGIQALARKNNLAKNLMRMLKEKELKDEYNFFPKTW